MFCKPPYFAIKKASSINSIVSSIKSSKFTQISNAHQIIIKLIVVLIILCSFFYSNNSNYILLLIMLYIYSVSVKVNTITLFNHL